MKLKMLTLTFTLASAAHSQDMSLAETQCRSDAKEIAIKSYQSCITEARTARLDNIRKEYQEKLADLKKQYDAQLQELKSAKNSETKATPAKEPKNNMQAEPTVTLKKASSLKSDKKTTKGDKKAAAKVKKPTHHIITEAELEKTAPPAASTESATANATTLEYNTTTDETESIQMVDPTLPTE